MKKNILLISLLGIFILLSGCASQLETNSNDDNLNTNQTPNSNVDNQISDEKTTENKIVEFDYKQVELKDINTNLTYKISDFENEIVLIESFAIWCPSCTNQQKELKKLHQINPDIISISLDTDQNEDESEVLAHTQKHNFDWRYSISPQELTSYFISNYGITFAAAPAVPILLKCPNSEPKILNKKGFKSIDYITKQIEMCN